MTADTDQYGDSPWGPRREWTAEERLTHRYHQSVGRLMEDYQPSYDPDGAEQEWLTDQRDDYGPYSGPFYRTAARAQEWADYYREEAEAASAALPAAEAALRAAAERLDELRSQLAGTWPWQRHRREQLRAQVSDTKSAAGDLYSDLSRLESTADSSVDRHYDAARIAGVLRRHERARLVARDAVTRTLGWRPGQAPSSRPQRQPVPMPGGRATVTRARPATAGVPGTAAAPLLMPPPSQAPPGLIPSP